jgi:hypothetical protein
MLEVGDAFVKAPPLQVVVDGHELLVFTLNFSGDGVPVCLKLGMSLVVMLVSLDLCRGHEVKATDCHSQGKEWGPCGLEELFTPVGHGVKFSL